MTVGYTVIHRDSLSLTPLMIDGTVYSGASFKIDDEGIVASNAAYDIDETSSPFVEGSQVTNDIRGMVAQQMRIQVRADTQADLQAGIGLLFAAVQQNAFQVDLVLSGVTWSWSCRRKTYGVSFDRSMVFSQIAVVPLEFDRYPTPIAGPY